MKKWILLLAIMLLIPACSVSGTEAPTEAPESAPIEEMEEPLPSASSQDIIGTWILDVTQYVDTDASMLDPLLTEIYEASGVEITDSYLVFGNFGHTYSWIDTQRIRINGVGVGFASFNEGFFYVLTVQRDGNRLRFLLADGTSFAVFGRPGTVSALPASDAPTVVEATETTPPTVVPAAPAPWTPCEGGYETHLFKGGYAYVNPVPPDPNIVRSAPDNASAQTGLIQPNELVEVVDGPQCSGGWVWWQITSKQTGLSGWTAEGDGNSYWVLPCPQNGSECGAP